MEKLFLSCEYLTKSNKSVKEHKFYSEYSIHPVSTENSHSTKINVFNNKKLITLKVHLRLQLHRRLVLRLDLFIIHSSSFLEKSQAGYAEI